MLKIKLHLDIILVALMIITIIGLGLQDYTFEKISFRFFNLISLIALFINIILLGLSRLSQTKAYVRQLYRARYELFFPFALIYVLTTMFYYLVGNENPIEFIQWGLFVITQLTLILNAKPEQSLKDVLND